MTRKKPKRTPLPPQQEFACCDFALRVLPEEIWEIWVCSQCGTTWQCRPDQDGHLDWFLIREAVA